MKTALVTGGAAGIGRRIVKKLYEDGFKVAIAYNTSEEEAVKLRRLLPGCIAVKCDVSSPRQVNDLYDKAIEKLGAIDVVVNNAGVAYTGLLQEMSDEDIDRLVGVDLKGVIYSCRKAASVMVPQHRGCIINISSVWGLVGASCEAVYSACKGGIITLTKALAKELGPVGIRVNCVSPGVIRTKMLDCYTEDELQALADETPLSRLGDPCDIAWAVRFLAGEGAGFITGCNLTVDGGFSL